MNTPHDNVAAVTTLLAAVQVHPMCAKFQDDGAHYLVYYPEGYWPDGARVSQGMGKAKALTLMIKVMERHWVSNGIHG